jgi:hypothetical protein
VHNQLVKKNKMPECFLISPKSTKKSEFPSNNSAEQQPAKEQPNMFSKKKEKGKSHDRIQQQIPQQQVIFPGYAVQAPPMQQQYLSAPALYMQPVSYQQIAQPFFQVDNSVNIHNHGLQQPMYQPMPQQQYIMTYQGYQPLPDFNFQTPQRLQNGQFHSLQLLQRKMMSYQ